MLTLAVKKILDVAALSLLSAFCHVLSHVSVCFFALIRSLMLKPMGIVRQCMIFVMIPPQLTDIFADLIKVMFYSKVYDFII